MKLVLLDQSENTWYEIIDPSTFETASKEDLKEIYHEIYVYFYIQDILDELKFEGKIKEVDEEGNEITEENEYEKNYRYTMKYIELLLKEKMTNAEFEIFNQWCKDQLRNNNIKK
jgi:hypothetical protein